MAKPYIIGITGGSGSGKTSLVEKLRETFTQEQLCFISQDDYYKPKEFQKIDEEGIANFDMPRSIYKKEFQNDLQKLMDGEVVTREEYMFNNDEATPKTLTFHPAPVIIVEGLFIFHYKKVRKLLDLKIFVHAKENLKVIRRIKRDRVERNYPLDDVLYRYQHHVLPNFEKYIRPYMEQADIVINNNDSFNNGLKVLTGFLKDKLEEEV